MIQITDPFLPPQEEYQELLKGIWDRNWLTNNGPMVKELEQKLVEKLGVDNFTMVTNGTISLQIAAKALELSGEVITTPFSYVATVSSLVWENLTPVFADISPDDFNVDPDKIASAITDQTSAIMVTHVFGVPCKVEQIAAIAKQHGIKVIYDAAHAFGVKYKGRSVLREGDVSSISMHATKLFHSIEGGGLITESEDLVYRFARMRNFGHNYEEFDGVGINGKCSEFHAAMGLINLKYIDQIIARRKEIYQHYLRLLADVAQLSFQKIDLKNVEYNYSYFPVLFETEHQLLHAVDCLNKEGIYPRRYFYPALNTLTYLGKRQSCPQAESIAQRILCLPSSHNITNEQLSHVASVIKESLLQQ